MKTRSTIALICLLIALLATSCTNKAIDEQLSLAESIIMDRPDSALSIMNAIETKELTGDRQRALYALLMTQAKDRNRVSISQDDSMISSAVEYFKGKRNERKRLGRSYFYSGKILHIRKDDEGALHLYLEAKNTLEGTDDYNYLSFVHQYIGRINDDRRIYSAALENYKKSVMYNEKFGDTHRSIYSYRNMAWIYEEMNEIDSAKLYLTKACSLLGDDTLSPVYASIARLRGKYEAKDGHYDKAIALINSAIRNEKLDVPKDTYYASLGVVYMMMKNFDAAEGVFNDMLSSEDYKSEAYSYLSQIEKEKCNYQQSLRYKEISDSLSNIENDINLQNKISDIQKRNEKNMAEMERKILVRDKRLELYGWLFTIVCFIGFVFLFYKMLERKYRSNYKRKIRRLLDRERNLRLENEKREEEYNAKIVVLKRDANNSDAIEVLAKLKTGVLIEEYISTQERMNVFDMMDSLYDSFVKNLKSEYLLNDKDVMFLVLLRLGFSTNEIATVFEYENNTIYKKKQRMKARLKQSSNNNINTLFN